MNFLYATLPLIHAIAHADATTQERLRSIVETGDTGAMPEVLAAIERSGSIAYSQARASDFAQAALRALDVLPDNEHVAALRGLAGYAVERNY